MITAAEYLMGRDTANPITKEMYQSMIVLLEKVNNLIATYCKESGIRDTFVVSSGYRPAAINAQVAGAAKHSAHMTCEAVDIVGPDYTHLREWLLANTNRLVVEDLYMEDPATAKTWIHLSTRRPGSGNRVFKV